MKLLIMFSYFCILITNSKTFENHVDNSQLDINDDFTEELEENEVRCFCNLPTCVMTGYMCKTTNNVGGGCFTDVSVSGPVQKASHGCVDLLDDNRYTQCRNEPPHEKVLKTNRDSGDKTSGDASSSSLLLCCYEDLCNHMDIPENHIKYNDSVMAAVLAGSHPADIRLLRLIPSRSNDELYDNNETWFRAATIAVPICGALILFILITLAVKILRSDIEDAKINGKFRSKNGGGTLPSYTPIHYDSSTRMSGYLYRGSDNLDKEMKNINENITKPVANKIPLLLNYKHDERKNDSHPTNLQQYEQNVNIVNECSRNLKQTNKILYNDCNIKNDSKNKLNCIVNNKLKE